MSFLEDVSRRDQPVVAKMPDVISPLLGQRVYADNHRFDDMTMTRVAGTGPRLMCSRFYFRMEPKLAIDFLGDIRFGREEVRVKKAYFEKRGWRYMILKDEWDIETLEDAPVVDGQAPVVSTEIRRPKIGPRKRL